ncbi:anthranilate synthase component II [Halococcus saccharolyticus]|uniref:anthranilate synthase n=1 Tax=Halococcus saccharolyticus DSM 5350 TaxID=1227455 RepID=M0MRA8_9EURY|nr:aminodeoxychorismate/anthranilate synthase component II [Halococcus saccharolyticus]EMA47893.1 anthranilate synthase component II [Halococcus saccharolyticus DSM 5350]
MTRILVIDNYDSFAYNLVQYAGAAVDAPEDGEIVVRRNDAIDVAGIRELDPDGIVVSPGPGTPADAGVSIPVFRELDYPTLGVCLGHQALCAAHGAPVGHAPSVVHGKPSTVRHDGEGVFEGLPETFAAGRYHSLAIERDDLPGPLVETAQSEDTATSTADGGSSAAIGTDGVVMGVRHRELPHEGVQFHPESILTDVGMAMLENFERRCRPNDR